MKRSYCKLLYNQRNKNETIVSVIKRLFGEHITSRLVKTQNGELSFRCIAYDIHILIHYNIQWFLLSRKLSILSPSSFSMRVSGNSKGKKHGIKAAN